MAQQENNEIYESAVLQLNEVHAPGQEEALGRRQRQRHQAGIGLTADQYSRMEEGGLFDHRQEMLKPLAKDALKAVRVARFKAGEKRRYFGSKQKLSREARQVLDGNLTEEQREAVDREQIPQDLDMMMTRLGQTNFDEIAAWTTSRDLVDKYPIIVRNLENLAEMLKTAQGLPAMIYDQYKEGSTLGPQEDLPYYLSWVNSHRKLVDLKMKLVANPYYALLKKEDLLKQGTKALDSARLDNVEKNPKLAEYYSILSELRGLEAQKVRHQVSTGKKVAEQIHRMDEKNTKKGEIGITEHTHARAKGKVSASAGARAAKVSARHESARGVQAANVKVGTCRASAGASVADKKLTLNAEAGAELFKARAKAERKSKSGKHGVHARADFQAFVANAKANATLSKEGLNLDLHAGAILAEAKASAGFMLFGRKVTITAKANVGVSANFKVSKTKDQFKLSAGASLGIGAGFELTVDKSQSAVLKLQRQRNRSNKRVNQEALTDKRIRYINTLIEKHSPEAEKEIAMLEQEVRTVYQPAIDRLMKLDPASRAEGTKAYQSLQKNRGYVETLTRLKQMAA